MRNTVLSKVSAFAKTWNRYNGCVPEYYYLIIKIGSYV